MDEHSPVAQSARCAGAPGNEERQRTAQLHQLAEASLALHSTRSLSAVLQVLADRARDIVGAHQAVAGMTVNEDGTQAAPGISLSEKYAAWRGCDEKPEGSALYAQVCRTNRSLRLSQAELEANSTYALQAGKHPPRRGWLAVPLVRRDGSNAGVLELSDKDEGEFTEDDGAVAVQLATIASVAIENARLCEALQSADRRKDEFLALLAHELRNPLASICNAVEFLRQGGPPEPNVQQARDVMDRQLCLMVRLIDDLLDVSRITRNKLELRKEQVELAAVLRSAVESSHPLIQNCSHGLTVSLPSPMIYVDADATRLAQVFINLLNNAAKYTERGGHIWLIGEQQGNDAVVTVRDNGIGIPGDMLPGIFDMFTQLDRSLERSQGGLGIGLTLVRRLVEMHGGSIEARSNGPGEGSEFVVRLPVLIQPPHELPPQRHEPNITARGGCRILLVDDNKDSADSLAMLLRLNGHEVYTGNDGEEAVIAAEKFRPDVVLLDIGMPMLNGYGACRRIRAKPWGKDMILIALSGWGQEEDLRCAAEAGFNHHLVKPVDFAVLMNLLARAVPTPV